MAGILDQQEPNLTNTEDPGKTYYQDLVGEDKPFKDNEALAKSKYMADTHIKMLERRIDELRADYLKEVEANQTTAKLSDLIKALEQKQQPLTSSDTSNSERSSPQPQFDLNELDQMMSKRLEQGLTAYEQANRQKENTKVVVDKLKERYGSDYQPYVKQQIQSLGMTEELFNSMVKDAPQALLRTLGMEGQVKEKFQTPPKSGAAFEFKGEPKRTWSYYQELKKKNPRLYHDPKTLIQMEKDSAALGEEFEDGDFSRFDK